MDYNGQSPALNPNGVSALIITDLTVANCCSARAKAEDMRRRERGDSAEEHVISRRDGAESP